MANHFSSDTPHIHILLQFRNNFVCTNGDTTVVLFSKASSNVNVNLLNDDTYRFLRATIICVISQTKNGRCGDQTHIRTKNHYVLYVLLCEQNRIVITCITCSCKCYLCITCSCKCFLLSYVYVGLLSV